MSIKKLTDDEWASYQIGVAIRKHLDAGNHDPETLKHIEAVFGWLRHWIDPDELHSVSVLIGYFIDGDFDGEVPSIMGHSSLYQTPPVNDEVPEFRGDIFLVTEPPPRPARVRKPPKPDGKRP
jgi:hypothetical protein